MVSRSSHRQCQRMSIRQTGSVNPATRFCCLKPSCGSPISEQPSILRRRRDCCLTRTYRIGPPEAVFDSTKPLTFSSDIWSLGLMVWEGTGSGPFMSGFLFGENEVIADQVDALGPLPHEWWEKWETRTNVSTEGGQPKGGRKVWPLQKRFDLILQRGKKTAKLDDEESRAFLDMIKGMLRFRPEECMTADQVLRSEWMSKWALPLAEKAWERKLLN
ncbi:hypothetical protein FOPG_03488 [Fusarium oxysporum f. sp. conglutinans race 2 54008]|uniref:Protein kinase domain-containing protein n=1 Tax=Fusarium oxysporum f. sp. conglutinans race 2 54008 TaxID=1089457 RepID=X0IIY3_FUSOX|nr:hypothetical protein FOPG_03488 [Fusarium oxysporum f. sp. conglutinans race 2 54008]